ncbi:GNAT family N-acetyltransferase [Flavisphingomonas formosensis]|uniref:GNAT family N-acetyltransferase n=1 Tax=Flavisphingomonas formosensis TaxID=861534 RepID=UPI0038CD4EBC
MPDILEVDINPLLVDADGVVALDARVRITPEPRFDSTLVIRPVPMEWSAELATRTGYRFHVRPVLSGDEPLLARFFERVAPDDLRHRFLSSIRKVSHDQLSRMTRVDYRRTISFLGFDPDGSIIAVGMLAADPDRTHAEVALATRADRKQRGISWSLLSHIMRYAKSEGIHVVEAIEQSDHLEAIRMEEEMGFTAAPDPNDPTLWVARRVMTPSQDEQTP